METMKAIAKRKSVRAYQDRQIPNEALELILGAGCAAPVGRADYQSLHLAVIQDQELLSKITKAAAAGRTVDPLYNAPTLILISAAQEQLIEHIEYTNVGCIAENMMLAATDQDVGSVYLFGAARAVATDAQLCQAARIPAGFRPIGSVALGYPVTADESEKDLQIKLAVDYV